MCGHGREGVDVTIPTIANLRDVLRLSDLADDVTETERASRERVRSYLSNVVPVPTVPDRETRPSSLIVDLIGLAFTTALREALGGDRRRWYVRDGRSWYWTEQADGTLGHPLGYTDEAPPAGAVMLERFPDWGER